MSDPDGEPPQGPDGMPPRTKRPPREEGGPPLKYPDDFPVDMRYISAVDYLGPYVYADSPFDHIGNNFLKRAVDYLATTIKYRPWNLPWVCIPAQQAPKMYVTRLRFGKFKRSTEAQITFLKKQINSRDAQIRKMKLGTAALSKEQEVLRTYILEVAADLRQQFARGDTIMADTQEQVAKFKTLLDDLTKCVGALQPVKSKFRIKDLESVITLRARLVTGFQEMFLLTGLVSMFLRSMGYLQPEKTIGPPLYESTEKKTIELFTGFNFGMHLDVQSIFSNRLGISTGLSRNNGIDTSNLLMRFSKDNVHAKISSNLLNSVSAKVSANDFWCPDMKLMVQMGGFPYNIKSQLKGAHKYGAFSSSLGFVNDHPQAYISASLGTKEVSACGYFEMDPAQLQFNRYGAGVTLADDLVTARLTWSKVDDVNLSVLKASVLCELTPDTTLGTQLERNFTTAVTRTSIGVEHAVDDQLKIKATLSNDGTFAAMVKQRLFRRSTLSVCSDFNVRDQQVVPRFGISFSYLS